MPMRRTAIVLDDLPADGSCLVLKNSSQSTPFAPAQSFLVINVLFRVGRICAKVYMMCMLQDASHAGAAERKMLSLAGRAAAKSWAASREPHTVLGE